MRLVSFTLPNDPVPRTGVLAHDGARVVDLTAIGVASIGEGAARAAQLARLAGHLLHMPGALAHAPAAVRLGAPARRLVAVYDSATGSAASVLAADVGSAADAHPAGPDAAVPLRPGLALGAGVACVLARRAEALAPEQVEAHVAGLALVVCWRADERRIESAVLGPWLATLDEFTEPRSAPLAVELEAALAVNDAVLRGGSWSALTAKLARAVVDASRRAPLEPGDAVAVATFELAAEPPPEGELRRAGVPRYLPGAKPGDRVVLEAERLGVLRAVGAPAHAEATGATAR